MKFIPSRDNEYSTEYTDAVPLKGIRDSDIPPSMINALVQELLHLIRTAGIEPNTTHKQIVQAINALVEKHTRVAYLFNNINDIISSTGLEINTKNTTLLATALYKLITMPKAYASTTKAGSVKVGNDFSVSESGILNNKLNLVSTIQESGIWNILNISLTKPLMIIHQGNSPDSTADIICISGVLDSKTTYRVGTSLSNHLLCIPTDNKVSLNVVLSDSRLVAYQ